jgi:outer membrane protein TolC
MLMAEVNLRMAQTGIKLARAGLEPRLGINLSGDYYPTVSFSYPRQQTAAITAMLTIPLYDGGATRDKIGEARLRKDNAETSVDSIKSNISLDTRNAYLNWLTAANQIEAANSALRQAIATRQLAQIRYEGQVGLYLEITDAQTALVAAENNQVNAVYDYLVARAQFKNAIGAPETE